MSTRSDLVLIETKTVGAGGSATLEFTGIPSTFTDIQVVISARSASALDTGNVAFNLAINGSTADKTFRRLYGVGGSVGSDTSSTSARAASAIPTSGASTSTFGNVAYYFPNYASTTENKSFSLEGGTENNSSTAYEIDMAALKWSLTSAITSLSFSLSDGSNFVENSSASLYGIASSSKVATPKATGGIISTSGGYVIHTFTASGTFTPTQNLTDVEYLVIAGGGSGAVTGNGTGAGGGGAGGYRSSVTGESSGGGASAESKLSLTSGTAYTVTVGAGGSGGGQYTTNTAGSDSVFGSITSVGGGRGGGWRVDVGGITSSSGGSGGGAGYGNSQVASSGTSSQGYAGGSGVTSGGYPGGGGGGAGSIGGSASSSTVAGAGGSGVASSITGTSVTRAGGGGAGVYGGTAGAAGSGGAGAGANGGAVAGNPATINTGSGGGGAGSGAGGGTSGGNGGSGIVIVRYAA